MNILVDEIGAIVTSMQNLSIGDAKKFGIDAGLESPFYTYGTRVEINRYLTRQDQDIVLKHKKYPLIALRLDTSEVMNNGVFNYDLNIAIFTLTKIEYTAKARYDNVIKPILIPLYTLFLARVKESSFMWPGNQQFPPHTKIDRPYWGIDAGEGSDRTVFKDPLDAIEILNLKINQKVKTC